MIGRVKERGRSKCKGGQENVRRGEGRAVVEGEGISQAHRKYMAYHTHLSQRYCY